MKNKLVLSLIVFLFLSCSSGQNNQANTSLSTCDTGILFDSFDTYPVGTLSEESDWTLGQLNYATAEAEISSSSCFHGEKCLKAKLYNAGRYPTYYAALSNTSNCSLNQNSIPPIYIQFYINVLDENFSVKTLFRGKKDIYFYFGQEVSIGNNIIIVERGNVSLHTWYRIEMKIDEQNIVNVKVYRENESHEIQGSTSLADINLSSEDNAETGSFIIRFECIEDSNWDEQMLSDPLHFIFAVDELNISHDPAVLKTGF